MVDNCSSLIGILIKHIQSIELNYNSGTIHFKAIFCLSSIKLYIQYNTYISTNIKVTFKQNINNN